MEEMARDDVAFETISEIHNAVFGTSFSRKASQGIGSFTNLEGRRNKYYGARYNSFGKKINLSIGHLSTKSRGSKAWKNTLSEDGKTITEAGKTSKSKGFSEPEPDLRAWFVNSHNSATGTDDGVYRFAGVYEWHSGDGEARVWKRVATKLRRLDLDQELPTSEPMLAGLDD